MGENMSPGKFGLKLHCICQLKCHMAITQCCVAFRGRFQYWCCVAHKPQKKWTADVVIELCCFWQLAFLHVCHSCGPKSWLEDLDLAPKLLPDFFWQEPRSFKKTAPLNHPAGPKNCRMWNMCWPLLPMRLSSSNCQSGRTGLFGIVPR